ncbi:MAG: flagellar hook-basal body complex protein, partial [Planctomycetota bacterium]|nr:flagellar hook-basal body complex protein [Planctomycetota bacterium]
MAIRALHSAATGMQAHLFNLDTIANNLANAGTNGFKRSRTNFEDLYYQHMKLPGATDSQNQLTPTGIHVGLGTRVAGTDRDHGTGSLVSTSGKLDLAIVGDGFFQVDDGGTTLYSRDGSFKMNAEGNLVLMTGDRGRLVTPLISIPQDAEDVVIAPTGQVSVRLPGEAVLSQIGQIELARFINSQGLLAKGDNLYEATAASGSPVTGQPGLES